MIQYKGFYIATKRYLVVDTPVFDEIVEGIQILQFFPPNNQKEGLILIAEFGVLDPHPMEIDVKKISDEFQSSIDHFSNQEKEDILYKIGKSGEFPKWFDILESEIFEKRRDSSDVPNVYTGKYVVDKNNKFSIHLVEAIGADYDSVDGEGTHEELSLVYHYVNKDMISIFRFVAFE